jgi:hypothetical protein
MVVASLNQAGIPIHSPIRKVLTRRIAHAYPIYERDYAIYFDRLDKWLSQIQGLLTFGRQGLFVHDNTHHTLFMAYAAAQCLGHNAQFDSVRWQQFRQEFESHVVED